MKSSRKNSKKLTWQHPEIPDIQEDEVLKTSTRQNSVLDKGDPIDDLYEVVPDKLDIVGLSGDPASWLAQAGLARDRSCSLPSGKGRCRLLKVFRR